MIANVKASGAGSIGLTIYPTYPQWTFEYHGMGYIVIKMVEIGLGLELE